MKQQGYLFTCDRCGFQAFSEEERLKGWGIDTMYTTRMLCPDCLEQYAMIKQRHKLEALNFLNAEENAK